MSLTRRLMKEITNQDVSNGKLPYFEEFFTDSISLNTKIGCASDTLNLGDYLGFITFNIKEYKKALKKRDISKNISFGDFLLLGRKIDTYKLQELKTYMNQVTILVDSEEEDEE